MAPDECCQLTVCCKANRPISKGYSKQEWYFTKAGGAMNADTMFSENDHNLSQWLISPIITEASRLAHLHVSASHLQPLGLCHSPQIKEPFSTWYFSPVMVLTLYNQVTSWSSLDELKGPNTVSLGDISDSIWKSFHCLFPTRNLHPLFLITFLKCQHQNWGLSSSSEKFGKSAPNSHSLIPLSIFLSIM